jgi:hypothetical protein
MLTSCVLAAFLVLTAPAPAQDHNLHLTDLNGHAVEALATTGTHIVVLIFAATDCPISRRYIPEIARLEQQFSKQGVAFWWVYPNPGDTAQVVRAHASEFSMQTSSVIDTQQKLVKLAHATVTPEAAIFRVDGLRLIEVYHGRIDDRYLSFSRSRPAATRHELEDAIEAALHGKTVAPPAGGPIGCAIVPLDALNRQP